MPGESSSETENPYGRMHVTEPVRETIPVQNGARLSWDRSIGFRTWSILERFSKPNIRFGSGRTGSKIVSKFRLTHNRKLRSANRNTIYHTIACPAQLLWCLAVENRGPCVPKKCSLSNCASPGDSFCQVLVLDHR